jgi:hypothetical protein
VNTEITLWAGNGGFLAHSGFMPSRTQKLHRVLKSKIAVRKRAKQKANQYMNDVEKNQLAIRAVVANRKSSKIAQELEQREKKKLAIRDSLARVNRMDASQNALRIVEQTIGGKLIEKKRRLSLTRHSFTVVSP